VRGRALALVLVALLAACGGEGQERSTGPLTETGFADKAAAAILIESDLRAQALGGLRVAVASDTTLSSFTLPLTKAYAEYKARPARLNEILRQVVADAEATMSAGNEKTTFAQARSHIFPLLKPVTALRGLTEEPAATPFPGNLHIIYLVQLTHSVMTVRPEDVERWGHSLRDIHELALANLLRLTKKEQPLRCEEELCGWASGDGWDAVRLVVPELRRQIVEEIGPAVYAVPMESVYVALPIKLADRIRPRVEEQFVTAKNPVSQDLFVERQGELVVLGP
jgi:uncharacterized protein YtpQ (UPF0354 family)